MNSNRIKTSFDHQPSKEAPTSSTPESAAVAPGQTASTQQIYAAAWTIAKRDWELNRLFNAWYYEI